MPLPTVTAGVNLSAAIDLSSTTNATAIALLGSRRLSLSVSRLPGSSATLAVDGSKDNGATWIPLDRPIIDYDTAASPTGITDDGDYHVVCRGYTHIRAYPAIAGTGTAGLLAIPLAPAQDVLNPGGNVGRFFAQFGPASSTTFAANSFLAPPIEITGMGRVPGGSGVITSAIVGLGNVPGGNFVDMLLFSSQPSGTYAAGSAATLTSNDRAKCLGVFRLCANAVIGGSSISEGEPREQKFYTCDDGNKTQSLWALVRTSGAITLAAPSDATLTVRSLRN